MINFAQAAIGISALAPFQRIKILLQTQSANPHIISKQIDPYTGWRDCFIRILDDQGFVALWRGNAVACASKIPSWAAFVVFRDFYSFLLPAYDRQRQRASALTMSSLASLLAGISSSIFIFPLDLARTRLAADATPFPTRSFHTVGDLFSLTMKQGPRGVFSLYHGAGTAFSRHVLYRMTHFTLFDTIKPITSLVYGPDPPTKRQRFFGNFVVAQFSTLVAALIVYPLDTIVHRLQMQAEKPLTERIYSSALHCFRKTISEEGWRGLYRGSFFHVISAGSAVAMVLYDELKQAIIN